MDECHRAPRDDQAAVRAARESRNRALDLSGVAHIDRGQFDTERWGHGLDRAELANSRGYGGITYEAIRVNFGNICFRRSSPFSPMPYLKLIKPLSFTHVRAKLLTEA